jgi:steroid delta-isomerase-like uncharacterized protein
MDTSEMIRLFEAHREAEAARDIDAILETFSENCFLETIPLALRAEGRDAVRAAYEQQFFRSFPDLAPDDEGMAVGDDVVVVWGTLRGTSCGQWLGVPPGGGSFAVPFANVVPFEDGLMAGERIYFDLASLCEQAGIPLDAIRTAAAKLAAGRT